MKYSGGHQAAFNIWSRLPIAKRTAETLLKMLDFDFFELLDSVTIARSRKHIQKYYDATEVGPFPKRLKPVSYFCDLTKRDNVIGYNEIFRELSRLTLALYAPFNYILPSRMGFYEEQYGYCSQERRKPEATGPREKPTGSDADQPAQKAGEFGRSFSDHSFEDARKNQGNNRAY